MPLEVRPLLNGDAEKWASLYYTVYKDTSTSYLWHSEPSRESNVQRGNTLKQALGKPNSYVFKCVDTDLNDQIIAVAYWKVYSEERSKEEVESEFTALPQAIPEENQEARVDLMQNIYACRREVMGGRPHVLLSSLLCDPQHQRRGAGTMLLRFGIEKQDELGLPGYLDASKAGQVLYSKLGYRPIRTNVFDSRKYGANAVEVHTTMIREPQRHT